MKIIYPELSYAKALELSGLLTLYDRREAIAAKLFDEMYVINLTVFTNYFQVNTNQATPGDLVTSLRETGEKMLLPYPIRQPARSREFAFAVILALLQRLEFGIVL